MSHTPEQSPDSKMTATPAPASAALAGNRLLAALPESEYGRLAPHLERIEPSLKYSFYESGVPISHVYFPVNSVGSLLMQGHGDEMVEVATVGNEGMIGVPVFLGQTETPGQAFLQVQGALLRMPVEVLRDLVVDKPGSWLQPLLQRYTHALMVQMAQGVACNRLHTIEQRAARWLLMTSDRVDSPTFQLTQEFLGQMLGVRRAGVSEVASQLQADGLITYTRGIVTILDRARLEARACVCYRIIRDEFERLLGAD